MLNFAIWKVLLGTYWFLAITANPLEKRDAPESNFPTKCITYGKHLDGAHHVDKVVELKGDEATEEDLFDTYSFPAKTGIKINKIEICINLEDNTIYDANIIKGGIGENHVDLQIKAKHLEPVHCHVFVDYVYDTDNVRVAQPLVPTKYIKYGAAVDGTSNTTLGLGISEEHGQIVPDLNGTYTYLPNNDETGPKITKIEIFIKMESETTYDANVIEGGIGENWFLLEMMAKNVSHAYFNVVVHFVDDTKVEEEKEEEVVEKVLPKQKIIYGAELEDASCYEEVVVTEPSQSDLSNIYSFPPKTGIKITKIEALIEMQSETTYQAYIVKGGIGHNHIDLKIKTNNSKPLSYQVFVCYAPDTELDVSANFLAKTYGYDVEGASRYVEFVEADYNSIVALDDIYSFPPKNDMDKTPDIKITKIEVFIKMESETIYDANIIEGGIGKNHVDLQVQANNFEAVSYKVVVYYVYDTEVDVFANFLSTKYLAYGTDVKCAFHNMDEVVLFAGKGANQSNLYDKYSFAPKTGINITKIEVLFSMKDGTTPTFDANIIAGGIGKNHVDLQVKSENVAKHLDYKVIVYFVHDLIPKKYIKYGKDVEGTQLFSTNQTIDVNFAETEFRYIFDLFGVSHQTIYKNLNYITKIVIVFDKYDAMADYNATIISGGIGKDQLTMAIKTKNANHVKYQINIYYRTPNN